MDRIQTVMKCVLCHSTLESPVILPCSCNICYKHVSNQINGFIQCEKCEVEHQISTNGFHANKALQVIIETEIANLDFGNVHKEAKKSCESVENALKEFELLLKDPFFYTYERISELKNIVQLKGEELKLIIDDEMKKIIDRLEEYERQSKEYLSSNEFKLESEKLENELKVVKSNLNSWLECLNKIKIDEGKWKSIKKESDQKLKSITEEMDKFKNKLLLNKFEENQRHVNRFKNIKVNVNLSANRDFLVSRIINENLSLKLEELLKNKALNGQKWSLLYRGSQFGFRSSDFHSLCDDKPNTLTIIKSTSGNIFGGFTSAQWKSYLIRNWEYDNSAFIFSLVNKENRPLLFEHSSFNKNSLSFYTRYGPVFGGGNDIFIADSSNTNTNSYSSVGYTYIHPDYPYGSDKARSILAGTFNFQVQDIEVFQMQEP